MKVEVHENWFRLTPESDLENEALLRWRTMKPATPEAECTGNTFLPWAPSRSGDVFRLVVRFVSRDGDGEAT